MKYIYAIRDRLAQDIAGPEIYKLMVFRTDTQAIRYFGDAIHSEKSMLSAHPGDYELIRSGSMDDDGKLTQEFNMRGVAEPLVIITGDALVAATEPKLVKDA